MTKKKAKKKAQKKGKARVYADRQYLAVGRDWLGLIVADHHACIAQLWQLTPDHVDLTLVDQRYFLKTKFKEARQFISGIVGKARYVQSMTARQHAQRLGMLTIVPSTRRAMLRRVNTSHVLALAHRVVVRKALSIDGTDLRAIAAAGFSSRRMALLSDVKEWASETLLAALQTAREQYLSVGGKELR